MVPRKSSWTHNEKQLTVSSRSGRFEHMMWWYFVCSREDVCFRTWVPVQNLTILVPIASPQTSLLISSKFDNWGPFVKTLKPVFCYPLEKKARNILNAPRRETDIEVFKIQCFSPLLPQCGALCVHIDPSHKCWHIYFSYVQFINKQQRFNVCPNLYISISFLSDLLFNTSDLVYIPLCDFFTKNKSRFIKCASMCMCVYVNHKDLYLLIQLYEISKLNYKSLL